MQGDTQKQVAVRSAHFPQDATDAPMTTGRSDSSPLKSFGPADSTLIHSSSTVTELDALRTSGIGSEPFDDGSRSPEKVVASTPVGSKTTTSSYEMWASSCPTTSYATTTTNSAHANFKTKKQHFAPRVSVNAHLLRDVHEVQNNRSGFSDSLDRKLEELRDWVVSEFSARSAMTQRENTMLRHRVSVMSTSARASIAARTSGKICTKHSGPLLAFDKQSSIESVPENDLISPGPQIKHTARFLEDDSTPHQPTIICYGDEWDEEVEDVDKNFPLFLGDPGENVSDGLETTYNVAAALRWTTFVRKLNTPKNRVAAMKKFLLLSVWCLANRPSEISKFTGKDLSISMNDMLKAESSVPSSAHTSVYSRTLRCSYYCIVHPDSPRRTFWLAVSLVMILYDLVMVPIMAFFNVDEESESVFLVLASWISRIFWSVDIVVNFFQGIYINGALIMTLSGIAKAYAKTWLIFDLCVVISQWFTLVMDGSQTSINVLLRGVRLVRLLRLLRLSGLHETFENMLQTHDEGVIVCHSMVKIMFMLIVIIHVQGCVWYGVGRTENDGWAHDPAIISNSLLHNYLISVQWAASQIHGSGRTMAMNTLERSFSVVSTYSGLLIFSHFLANATLTVLQFNNVNRWKTQAMCARFCNSHTISPSLSHRMQHYLNLGRRRMGMSETVKEEAGLLAALPPKVRVDVIDEARWPLLKNLQVFTLMLNFSQRTVRKVSQGAITVLVALEQETVFTEGDLGLHCFIVQFGSFHYHCARHTVYSPPARFSHMIHHVIGHGMSSIDNMDQTLTRESFLSEAVLWTKWEHTGDLSAKADGAMLVLHPDTFVEIVKERRNVMSIVAFYAHKFVHSLNQDKTANDLFSFELDAESMKADAEEKDKHLIFLSHYKAEAGTEATLMQEALTRMISEETNNPANHFEHPVFLDSANLQDLSQLRKHVTNSNNLVLLLTPGVLTRPWCLVEIATALNQRVRIVPVEVQRMGISFKYPDESFYQGLLAGKVLSAAEYQILVSEGLSLADVERSIRYTFTQIALPFSPHKSKHVRQAELFDILLRCKQAQNMVSTDSDMFLEQLDSRSDSK